MGRINKRGGHPGCGRGLLHKINKGEKTMITSINRGQYGQWIVTAEIGRCFVSRQYYGYNKREALALARQAITEGCF